MKKSLIISGIAAPMLFAGFTTYYLSNVGSKSIANEQAISKPKKKLAKKFIDKKTVEQINHTFYSHEKVQQGAEMAFVGYPSTFSKLVDSGQLTITGEITGLKSFVFESHPYTIADVGVKRVLRGDNSQQNKIIRVMFLGGNITKKEMLAPVDDKEFMNIPKEDATSDEIVTVEYDNNRLPKAGEKVALILSKTQAGTNNIPGEFWLINFSNKSVFFQDEDGKYRRIPEKPSIGGSSEKNGESSSQSENDWDKKDDEKMNDGMNAMINSK
ncbi:hypothetical protein ACFQAV_09770 [Companilactobacillus huachuanensis]|uniref:Uncharacterized protein n=1 Tax=Companilactobacillus huachuanensis TaxID=2559914 RepID=A0ABW1RLZ5_9LACO|nr:hypothetical protein [Companilactobacillus huachuanensis]